MSAERQISGMLRQIARQQDVIEIGPQGSRPKAAALAHVAEQYGYVYGSAHATGYKDAQILLRMYRDPSPEARSREAATLTAHPRAGIGGTAPGLEPGSLKPVPEAAGAVAVLKDLIAFDLAARFVTSRGQMVLCYLGCVLVTALQLATGPLVEAVATGASLVVFLTVALKAGQIHRAKLARRLREAGFFAVRDEQGRQRFLRPGQQLPGHANPFAA
ncbi:MULTISPECIES: hypothetical protein [unclassified Streptomyces]|uniref:hypothetical protein n=1 Tax=unclassified Streptomyces TaxID=2593676 RepID=UPI002E2AC284|nr:hypothetical protein [Streptomyces sp. NBC_01439]